MRARGVILLVTALVVLGLALFMFDFPRPASDDMAPSIRKGDLLLACRMCGTPARGDVVLFTPPDGNGLAMRRVVGLPGDRFAVKKGVMSIGGVPLPEREGGTLTLSDEPRPFAVSVEKSGAHEYRVIRDAEVRPAGERAPRLLADEYFLAADRRTRVKDSRDYGPIARTAVRSRVLRIIHRGDGDGTRSREIP